MTVAKKSIYYQCNTMKSNVNKGRDAIDINENETEALIMHSHDFNLYEEVNYIISHRAYGFRIKATTESLLHLHSLQQTVLLSVA